jgi:hypothetical protein
VMRHPSSGPLPRPPAPSWLADRASSITTLPVKSRPAISPGTALRSSRLSATITWPSTRASACCTRETRRHGCPSPNPKDGLAINSNPMPGISGRFRSLCRWGGGGWKAVKAYSKTAISSRASVGLRVALLGRREIYGGSTANTSSRCSWTQRAMAREVRCALQLLGSIIHCPASSNV